MTTQRLSASHEAARPSRSDWHAKAPNFFCACLAAAAMFCSGAAHGALSFDFTYVDSPSADFASRGWLDPNSLFQQNIRAAANAWGAQVAANATVVVRVDTTSYVVRAGGTGTLGRPLYATTEGKTVYEQGVLTRIITGDNPGENFFGYDIALGFDAAYVAANYWFDPQPTDRSAPVPAGRGDFVSVAMHEIGHALGFVGFREFGSGQITSSAITVFDDLSYFGGNGNPFAPNGFPNPMFFSGDEAAAAHGGDVPLTHKPSFDPLFTQNFYHLSACDPFAPDGLETTVMNGCAIPSGGRLYITPVDVAVLGDLGYPLAGETAPADFDSDGDVDGEDLVAWGRALGESDAADADGDGDSDGTDFLAWQRGLTIGAAVHQHIGLVPEPRAMALWCWAAWFVYSAYRQARPSSKRHRRSQ